MTQLEQWLSEATRGLSAESAEQVRAEIQQHYDSASEAGDDAIAALGNPRSANRAYRKVLLTEREALLAPSFRQPASNRFARAFLATPLVLVVLWVFSEKQHSPGFWPLIIAIFSNVPFASFFRPTTLERARVYTWVLGLRLILVVTIAAWFYGWSVALSLGAAIFGMEYFIHHQRLSIFRKLAAGQTWSLLPEEPVLTHVEAMVLRTLGKEPDWQENIAATILLIMVVGAAIWRPGMFAPMASWVVMAHFTRRALPFRIEEGSRRFRIAKWTAMVIAALLPVACGAPKPWIGAVYLALLFLLFDLRSIAIRRKLPVAQWPKRLYW